MRFSGYGRVEHREQSSAYLTAPAAPPKGGKNHSRNSRGVDKDELLLPSPNDFDSKEREW